MANSDNSYTTIFTWEIENVLSLQQETGKYEQSEIFSSKGPIGQEIKWVLRLYPRGIKKKSNKNVSVYLHLIDGNGSKEVKVDWNLAIINGKGAKVNKKKDDLCDYYLETMDQGWGFDDFISRSILAESKNFIVEGHKLILHSEIIIKKDLLPAVELLQEKEKTTSLKRKLEFKEEVMQKMRSDYDQYGKRCRAELTKLGNLIEKFKKDEETRFSKLSDYEQQFKHFREKIANAEKDKLAAIQKCRKDEEARYNKLQGKYDKLYNHFVRDSSKFIEENENDETNESSADDYAQNICQLMGEINNESKEPSTSTIVAAKGKENEYIVKPAK